METVDALLDRVKQTQQLPSDYQLAKRLGVTVQAVSNWRAGRSAPDVATAVQIAELIGQPPMIVIAMVEAEREASKKNPRDNVLTLWKRYAPRLLPAIIAALIVGGITTRSAKWVSGVTNHNSVTTLYIMRTFLRWLFGGLARAQRA